MNLETLINNFNGKIKIIGSKNKNITDIIYNSKNSKKETLFVALKGYTVNGHEFIVQALSKGSKAFLIEDEAYIEKVKAYILENNLKMDFKDLTFLIVENTRVALSSFSNTFFGFPSNKIKVVGITGTKGKTTVANYIREALIKNNIKAAVMGTNGIMYNDKIIETENTTPESYEIHKYIKTMEEEGIEVLVMEVSSGGIMNHRVDDIHFVISIFTNISYDHIGDNEHPTFEHYVNTKAKFFQMGDFSIINNDDEYSYLMKENAKNYVTCSLEKESDYKAENIKYPENLKSLKTYFTLDKEEYYVNSFGKFGVYNGLLSIIALKKLGLNYEEIKKGLSEAHVKGRLQIIDILDEIPIIVDYAHNRESLLNVLSVLKSIKPKRIITLFGSVGGKSKLRRKDLGEISVRYSDIVIITSDQPNFEKPMDIIDEIEFYGKKELEKIGRTNVKIYKIENRKEAIKKAIEIGEKGDIILLTGKGHENYQLIKGVRYYHSDEEYATEYANLRKENQWK